MTNPDPVDLAAIGWLRDAPADFRTALLAAAQPRHFPAGAIFWQAGEPSEGLLGIVRGEASLLHAMARPDTQVLHIVGPGFWGGYGALLNDRPVAMTLQARTAVDAVLVPRHKILAILTAQPQHWREIGRLTLENVFLPTIVAADLMIADSRQRCAATLLRLAGCRAADTGNDTQPQAINASQDEVAAMANTTRHTIGPILRKFTDAGLIKPVYRSISIVNVAALRAVADDF